MGRRSNHESAWSVNHEVVNDSTLRTHPVVYPHNGRGGPPPDFDVFLQLPSRLTLLKRGDGEMGEGRLNVGGYTGLSFFFPASVPHEIAQLLIMPLLESGNHRRRVAQSHGPPNAIHILQKCACVGPLVSHLPVTRHKVSVPLGVDHTIKVEEDHGLFWLFALPGGESRATLLKCSLSTNPLIGALLCPPLRRAPGSFHPKHPSERPPNGLAVHVTEVKLMLIRYRVLLKKRFLLFLEP
mmetsp:Transcript_16400/g.33356  ORF Transcript_16400/g.33356 Transcript_16400/m.33356 type:complete len:239 (+) Transcript_16400:384-1100(+)